MSEVRIKFDMEPVQQERPRATRTKYGIRMYDPTRTSMFKKLLRMLAQRLYRGKPLTGALEVTFNFYRQVQTSISHIEHDRRVSGVHRPTVKPDLSNYVKSAEDALNGVVWEDDALIVDEHTHKYYADHPYIELIVKQLDGDE